MLFSKKKQEKAVFKEGKTKNVNFFTERYIPRGGGNLSYSFDSTKASFEREDGTLINLGISKRKLNKLMKDKKGILTYRGNKFISFEVV